MKVGAAASQREKGGGETGEERGVGFFELIALSMNVPLLCSPWLFALEV